MYNASNELHLHTERNPPEDEGNSPLYFTIISTVFLKDPRFNEEIDKKTGYTTHSILCMPIKSPDGMVRFSILFSENSLCKVVWSSSTLKRREICRGLISRGPRRAEPPC